MRIDDAILSGSVVGSAATVSLTGSFTGSGHIATASISLAPAISSSYALTASHAITASYVESSSFAVTASHAEDIPNKIVDYATLGVEFTGSVSLGISDIIIDFSAGSIFHKINGGTDNLVFSNVKTGDVKTIVVTGGFALGFDNADPNTNCEFLDNQASYDGTKTNIISVVAISPGQQYATLNVTV